MAATNPPPSRLAAPATLFVLAIALALPAASAEPKKLKAELSSINEAPLTLATDGSGQFKAQWNPDTQSLTWELSYADLSAPITQSHIHIGAHGLAGGVSIFLCTNLGNGPAGTQACPAAPATISGTAVAADVIGPAAQGIAAGQLEKVVDLMREGVAYVNIHTTQYPGGEIRAQTRK